MGNLFIKMVASKVKAMILISRVLIKDIFNCDYTCFEWLSQLGKQIIITPLNKDHHATYHQGEALIP